MSEIKAEVIKVLNVMEESVKMNLPSEESSAKLEEIDKVKKYVISETQIEIQKEN